MQTVLVISQVYVPDPAAVGQYVAEASEALALDHRVVVLTSRRGYDDPSLEYGATERLHGVHVKRLRAGSFGKSSIVTRLAGGLMFTFHAFVRGLFVRDVSIILTSTAPQVGPLFFMLLAKAKRARFVYWLMDLNPEQMVHSGKITDRSVLARAFDWMNRRVMKAAAAVVVLDQSMARRVAAKHPRARLSVVPLWPLRQHSRGPDDGRPAREGNEWGDRLVAMYSGNHGLTSPIDTILDAAGQLASDDSVRFVFVGGGAGKERVDSTARRLSTVDSLPYQPLEQTTAMMSAADVHFVTMGAGATGIVHPSKIYGVLALGRPVIYVGPGDSHIARMLDESGSGWSVEPGDVGAVVRAVKEVEAMSPADRAAMGRRGRDYLEEHFARDDSLGRLVNRVVEAS